MICLRFICFSGDMYVVCCTLLHKNGIAKEILGTLGSGIHNLGGGFKHFFFHPYLPVEMIQFD